MKKKIEIIFDFKKEFYKALIDGKKVSKKEIAKIIGKDYFKYSDVVEFFSKDENKKVWDADITDAFDPT